MKSFVACAAFVAVAATVALAMPHDFLHLASKQGRNKAAAAQKQLKDAAAGKVGINAPLYFIYQTNGGATPIPNTRLATYFEVQSDEFVNYVNTNGLPSDPNTQMQGCCLFSIAEGYLTVRASIFDNNNYSYVAPYSMQGQHECASTLSGPAEFGCVEEYGYCQGTPLAPLTKDIVSLFAYRNTVRSGVGCGSTPQSFGIFKAITPPPQFIASGVGQDFPTPPKGYALATLADLQSQSFINEYNAQKLQWKAEAQMSGCCVVQLADGYWTSNEGGAASWWSFYTESGSFDCSGAPQNPIGLGFAMGVGPQQGVFVSQLTSDWVKSFNTVATIDPTLGCGTPPDTFAIYKAISS